MDVMVRRIWYRFGLRIDKNGVVLGIGRAVVVLTVVVSMGFGVVIGCVGSSCFSVVEEGCSVVDCTHVSLVRFVS